MVSLTEWSNASSKDLDEISKDSRKSEMNFFHCQSHYTVNLQNLHCFEVNVVNNKSFF